MSDNPEILICGMGTWKPAPNTLIVIGWIGGKTAYLNVPRDEAIARWCNDNNESIEGIDHMVEEFTFHDEFEVYDASGTGK